jgi:hypothetical protein
MEHPNRVSLDMTPHNTHPLGLAILCHEAPATTTLQLLTGIAASHQIRHVLIIGPHPIEDPAPATWINAPSEKAVAIAHSGNCQRLLIIQHDISMPELIDALTDAKKKQAHPMVHVISAPPAAITPAWNPADPVPLLGVTIITPAYQDIGAEASRRWHQFTGMPLIILSAPSEKDAYRLKLRLPEFLPSAPVCYFDADYWLLRPLDVPDLVAKVKEHALLAVVDPGTHDPAGFVAKDCHWHALDPSRYFNSGFWVADFSRDQITHAFTHALEALDDRQWADYGDQSAWNYGLQKYHVNGLALSWKYNFFLHAITHGYCDHIPAEVIGLHAAGVARGKKREHLTEWAKMLSYPVKHLPPPPPPEPSPPLAELLAPLTVRQFVPPSPKLKSAEHARAIAEAKFTLYDETATFDQRASALCYLTYRCIDGLITFEEWLTMRQNANEARVDIQAECSPLHYRWWISQTTAETYLNLLVRHIEGIGWVQPTLPSAVLVQFFLSSKKWPPQILNVLRVSVLAMYEFYLRVDDLGYCKNQLQHHHNRLLEPWIAVWDRLDLTQWPYRFEEAHADLRALTAMMFILRAAGVYDFKDQPWCPLERCGKEGYFGACLVKLGELNPQRALWKPTPL